MIQISVKAAGYFDIFFVNSMHLPFLFRLCYIFCFGCCPYMVWFTLAAKKNWYYLRLDYGA